MIDKIKSGDTFCSIEILPPRNLSEMASVLKSVQTMSQECNPLFYAVTWHLRDSSLFANNINSLIFDLLSGMSHHRQDILLHLASTGLSRKMVLNISRTALAFGINNFFALRGDRSNNDQLQEFTYAVDLVQFMREHFGRRIVLCGAGYPGGHPEAKSYEDDLMHLKKKVDAGIDFIITQIVFEADEFIQFVDRCRDIGITVPIIPGILPIMEYAALQRISKLCHLNIPKRILDIIEPMKDQDSLIASFGIRHATDMAKKILASKRTSGIHFFSLNRDKAVVEICKQLGFGSICPDKPLNHEAEKETTSEKYTRKLLLQEITKP